MKIRHSYAQISKKKIPVITGVFGREGTVFALQRKALNYLISQILSKGWFV